MESPKKQENKQKESRDPLEGLISKRIGFRNCVKLASECLRLRDFMNAELFYGSLLADLHQHSVDQLNLNDLEIYSLHCCFAYACVSVDKKSDQSLVMLDSLRKNIQLPLVPFLKAFVHVYNENFSSAHEELAACQKLFASGYNFKTNFILHGDCVPEINDEFLKMKIEGLFVVCNALKSKDGPKQKEDFLSDSMKLGILCEVDFPKSKVRLSSTLSIEKNETENACGTGAIKKSKTVEEKRPTKAIAIQTASVTRASIAVQTVEKCLVNKELMGTVMDIKNKVYNLQSRKDDEVKKLQKKISELTNKLEVKERAVHQLELLKQQQNATERKLEKTRQQLLHLQTLNVEQLQHKYQLQKNLYSMCEMKCLHKIEYLSDIKQYLNERTRLTLDECTQETLMWNKILNRLTRDKENMDKAYKNVGKVLLEGNVPQANNSQWPEAPEMPSDMQDIIYRKFKTVVQRADNPFLSAQNGTNASFGTRTANIWELPALWSDFAMESSPLWGSADNRNAPQGYQSLSQTVIQRPSVPSNQSYSNIVSSNISSAPNIIPPPSAPRSRNYGHKAPSNINPMPNFYHPPSVSQNYDSNILSLVSPIQKIDSDTIGYESEEELFEYLKLNFRDIDDLNLLNIVYQIRDSNGGTLVGLSRNTLVRYIKKKIKGDAQNTSVWPHYSWNGSSSFQATRDNDHSENKCCICFDEYTSNNSYTLLCQHEFHKKCITSWLKQKNACPVCRRYAVIEDEYPNLRSTLDNTRMPS